MQIQTMSVMSRDQLPNVLYRLKSDQIHSQVHGGGGGGGGGGGCTREKKLLYVSLFLSSFILFFCYLRFIQAVGRRTN